MRRVHRLAQHGRPASGWLAVTVLLVVLAAIPTSAVASARVVSGPSPVASDAVVSADATAMYGESFADRAGYSAAYSQEVSTSTPAAGSQSVVVTFYPTSPSFFTAPASGLSSLSLTEIAERYGLPPLEYTSAEAYFQSRGLSVVQTSPTRLSLELQGSEAALGEAFGTELESGTYQDRSVIFPQTPPSLPAWLQPLVSSVVGLTNGFVTFALAPISAVPASAASTSPAQGSDNLVTPAIARQIYDLSALYNVSGPSRFAVGEGIVLLLWGDGYSPQDLTTFFSNDYPSSFPLPDIQPYPVNGAPSPSSSAPNDPSKAPQELTLDMEWAGSMAPGATLYAVYGPDGPASDDYSPTVASMTAAFDQAVSLPSVSVISMSFGTPENASEPLQTAWATDMATATQRGITMLAATGDLGGDAMSSCTGGPSTDFPATSPQVLAVGGTNPTLARNLLGQVTGIASESAWDMSGGGFSSIFPAPSWETVGSAAPRIAAAGGYRGVPDVSAAAALNALYYNGQNSVAAGTSFASPLWGGLVAEMDALYGRSLGFLTPRLYAVGAAQESGKDPTGLSDITSGSTCIGSASAGWDPETGWGSPRALLLYEDLTATFVGLSVSAGPSTVAPGGTVTVTAKLTNLTSGAPIPGVAIQISLGASNGNGPCAGVWGSSAPASNASGGVSLSVAVPTCYFGSHATASVSVTSNGFYGSNSSQVAVNLLGFVPAFTVIEQYPINILAFVLIMGVAVAVGYALGRPRPSVAPSARPPGPPTPPNAAAPPSAPAPPATPSGSPPPVSGPARPPS